ncbi:MAG: hypothetical protein KIT31_30535 [Deltaproteobacteria bacterium]|nr:hypothetical protein [Deltaproteobacteria bacterium]
MVRIVLVAAACLAACWSGAVAPVEPPAAPPAPVPLGAMTVEEATAILAKLPPRERAQLQELWYMYDLQDVIGDEEDAERLMKRLEKELGDTVVLDRRVALDALARARGILAQVLPANLGNYEKSDRVAQPILEIILRPEELERRMVAFPPEVSTAWFLTHYYEESHYHNYRMHNRMFELLIKYGGRRGLRVVEDRIRDALGDGDSGEVHPGDWRRAVRTARKVLGTDFAKWYRRTLGRSYADDERRVRSEDVVD